MERDKALRILRALADGIDPASGEQFPDDSPYQRADTVRALCCAIQILEGPALPMPNASATPGLNVPGTARPEQPQPEKAARGNANAGRPWTADEETQLAQSFDEGRTIAELAQAHQRSRWAIEARLAKLGKIPEPPAGLRFPLHRPPGANEQQATYSPS
jgi:hypothetical protein